MALRRDSCRLRVMALAAWTMTLSLQWADSALAQGKHGSSEVPSPYRLSIGDASDTERNVPGVEHGNAIIPFTLSISVPLPGIRIAKNVLVCQERTIHVRNTGCTTFARIRPPVQLTGSIDGSFPLAGDSIKLVACENTAAPKGQRCGDTLAIDEKVIPLVADYSVGLTSATVLHTRAPSTDTTWVSWIADTNPARLSRDFCRQLFIHGDPKNRLPCKTVRVGELQDGPHSFSGAGVDGGRLPADSGSSLGFAFAVWNYGSIQIIIDPLTLTEALVDAALPVLSTMATSEQIDLTPALNDHPWSECDGPTAGMAFRMTGAQLDQLTRATGSFQQTIGPFVVPSQTGCGASSQYLINLIVHRDSF
jgi:hypothetical protein